jgi:hypothetical protein
MKKSLILLLVCTSLFRFGYSQTDNELWLSGGAKYSLTKKLDLSGELNLRMEPFVLNTVFTEFSAKYQVTKWFKPSVDYRIVLDRNKYGNYKGSQRLNLNANFGTNWNRFEFGMRVRLQTTLSRVRTTESSFSDLSPGWRIKPEVLYDINNSILSPTFSTEFFFKNDAFSGMYMNKVRIAAGVDFETIGPYNVSLKYMYGFSLYSPKYEHILAFSFTQKYKSEAAKKKKKKKKK